MTNQDLSRPAQRFVRRPKSLVLWSGGLNSTWTLVRLLRDTDDDVFAHHVHKRSRTDDGKRLSYLFEAEREAIRAIRPWLAENERPFTYWAPPVTTAER